MRRFAFGLVLFVGTATASCAFLLDTDELKQGSGAAGASGGGAGMGGAGGAASIPIEDLPSALATATCALVESCAGPAAGIFYGDEDCATITTRGFEDAVFGLIQASVDSGRAQYDGEKAAACNEAFKSLPCEDIDRWPAICDEALKGTVPDGGDCGHSIECSGDSYCEVSNQCPGKCTPQLPAGEACAYEDMCEDGLKCFLPDGQLPPGECKAPGLANAPCGGGTEIDCQLGFLCLGTDKIEGKCVAIDALFTSDEGIGCSLANGPLCKEGLHCSLSGVGDGGICGPPAISGGPCRLAIPDPCPSGEYCDVDITVGIDGVCTAQSGANQACVEGKVVLKPPCKAYHRCWDNVCKPLRDLDEPCDDSSLCYSGFCDNGLCKPPGGCQF